LLIADDVGTGKTIEAGIIAREVLDRGMARRLAVVCPAHLCDQWEAELREKFGIEAAVIQPSRIGRLERDLPRQDISIYQYYRHLIVSIDFIKSERNRGAFLQNAPDLVIVDEAHIGARPRGGADRVQHQRFEFLSLLAKEPARHLVLVTATPHSGIEESFRSLLGLLDSRLDSAGQSGDIDRAALLPYVVQRRRRDLVNWLGTETPFPERESDERTYMLSTDYHRMFDDVLAYCRESVAAGPGLRRQQQRVRHWAALALLRCVLSSPAAAVAVLGTRAQRLAATEQSSVTNSSDNADAVDQLYRPQVLDPLDDESIADYTPTAPVEDAEPLLSDSERRKLSAFPRRAQTLAGPDYDGKLAEVARIVAEFMREGRSPIVFCRFIATARYLESWLRQLLAVEFPDVRVAAVTGEIGDEERRVRVEELARERLRILVATDCLSEGVNLQESFDAVVHYDLPWNPNRLEQREGRVDRFGQPKPTVRTALLYGRDNSVDLVVLEVLVRKARTIRSQLGISVPIPVDSERVLETLVDNVLLRSDERGGVQLGFAFETPEISRLHAAWDQAAEREDRQRSYFAQRGIQPDEVARELAATDPVLGDSAAVERFLTNAAQRFRGSLTANRSGVLELHPGEVRSRLVARGIESVPLRVTFDRRADPQAEYIGRMHPVVAAFCDAVIGSALAPDADERFARCGAMYTDTVQIRTCLLLLRARYLLNEPGGAEQLAEEVALAAFERREGQLAWLEPLDSIGREFLSRARPIANMSPTEREEQVRWALDFVHAQPNWYTGVISHRVQELQASHTRLRKLLRRPRLTIEPRTPPDILGCYVLVPAGAGR
jgi:superfamily II DNA or RNA helicase